MNTTANSQIQQKLQLLGDKTRFKMFYILGENSNNCVSEIANQLNISVPAASQHFKAMENAGLVKKHREGQRMCYQIDKSDRVSIALLNLLKKN